MEIYVAVCDDEENIAYELERTLETIFSKLNVTHEIDVFFTGEELCRKMERRAHYNLIFLDISLAQNAINGVEAGKLIREAYGNNTVSIVYISWEMKYAMQLFDVRPFDFLIKPLTFNEIEKVIMTYIKVTERITGGFTYKAGHNTHKVSIKDIIYVESIKRKLILHFADGSRKVFYGKLKEIYQKQLQGFDFLFIHASYAVNYDYITAIKYNELFLVNNGIPLPISRNRRKEVSEAYCKILERRRV